MATKKQTNKGFLDVISEGMANMNEPIQTNVRVKYDEEPVSRTDGAKADGIDVPVDPEEANEPTQMDVPDFTENATPDPELLKNGELTRVEKQKIYNTVAAYTKEELEVVLDAIPIWMMFNRVGQELQRGQEFLKTLSRNMDAHNHPHDYLD